MGSTQQDFPPGRSRDFMDGKAILAKKIKDDQRQEDNKKSVLVGGKAGQQQEGQPHGSSPTWRKNNEVITTLSDFRRRILKKIAVFVFSMAQSHLLTVRLLKNSEGFVCLWMVSAMSVWIFSGTELSVSVLDVCTFFVHLSH